MVYNEKELKSKMDIEKSTIDLPKKKESIGDILKHKREESGKTIEEISNYLRIKSQYLKSLENNEFNNLPGSAYVIGFIKSYATYLKLNVNEIVLRYKQENISSVNSLATSLDDDENTVIHDPVINSNHIIIGIILVLISFLFIYLISSKTEDDNIGSLEKNVDIEIKDNNMEISIEHTNLTSNSSEVGNNNTNEIVLPSKELKENKIINDYFETKIDNVNMQNENIVEKTEEIVIPTERIAKEYGLEYKDDSDIYIKATKKIWVKLKKDGLYKYDADLGDVGTGETLFEAILDIGDIFYIPDEDNCYLTIGNAQGVDIIVDGEIIAPLSKKEVSRHNIEMDVEKLRNGTAYIRNRVLD